MRRPAGHGTAVLLAVGLLVGCGDTTVQTSSGAAQATSGNREVRGFTAVELATSGELTISRTGTESLVVSADADVLPLLTSEVVGETLVLGVADGRTVRTDGPIHYTLTVADLDTIGVTGSGEVTAPDLATDHLTVDVSGSGSVVAGGTADRQEVTVSGSGTYRGIDVSTRRADVEVSGSGDVEVAVSDTLDVRVGGSGSVAYAGDPRVTQDVRGSGEVTRR